MWWSLLFAGCAGAPVKLGPDADADADSDTDADGDTDADTDTDPCAAEAGLTVTAEVSTPWTAHEAEVDVTLSAPATVAVACTLEGDPTEVHLVESGAATSNHTLRLAGLLAGETYGCVAAATCPRAAATASFTIETGVPPRDLPPVSVETRGEHGQDYILLNHSDDCTWDTQKLLVFDRDGGVRWEYSTPEWVGPSVEFRYHGDDLFAWGGGWGPNALARPRLVDLYDGQVYDSAEAMLDVDGSLYHHDGKLLEDGRVATLEEIQVDADRGDFRGFQVRMIDPDTNVVEATYSGQRAYDEDHLPGGTDDAWHANWVDVRDRGDHRELYVSLCNVDTTLAVDADSGEWLWKFGEDGDFSLEDADGSPLPDDDFPQCQHGLERVGDNLLVYDNGRDRGESRAAEFHLDTENWIATRLWTWTEPDWYETTLGDVDYLPSGHILVTQGHAECFSSNPGGHTEILELDPVAGEKTWELSYDRVGEMAYRGDFADACTLFANAKYCPAVAGRVEELATVLWE